MGFIRRLLGGTTNSEAGESAEIDPAELDAAEREHELDLLRGEQERLDDLAQRQLRYAQYAWEPPPQGGDRRADDGDAPSGE